MTEYNRITDKKQLQRVSCYNCEYHFTGSPVCERHCIDGECFELRPELARLIELEDKMEQGLMVELPCKVGDTLYKVVNDKRVKHPIECKVIGIWICIREEDSNIHLAKYTDGVFEYSFSIPFSEIGKTIFLTEAEAVAKLRELQGE